MKIGVIRFLNAAVVASHWCLLITLTFLLYCYSHCLSLLITPVKCSVCVFFRTCKGWTGADNRIWRDLQNFGSTGAHLGRITGVDVSRRLFRACSALNCHLSYFDLFSSLWNWASLWFSLFPNHITPEIKKHAFEWGSKQWNMTKIK